MARLLAGLSRGDREAANRLLPLVYEELRRLADGFFKRERAEHTLQPTALVHEAYLRLARETDADWKGRHHFLAVAAHSMRRILINHAHSHRAAKRGGGWARVTLSGSDPEGEKSRDWDLLALDEALAKLEALSERGARVVELRFFGGLSVEETAEVLGVSPRTVKQDWRMAKAWLFRELKD